MEEQIHQEILNRTENSGDPISILLRFHSLMAKMHEQLLKLTAKDDFNSSTAVLDAIEECEKRTALYLQEEAFAAMLQQKNCGEANINEIPSMTYLETTKGGFVIRGIPLWMLGHPRKNRVHPQYHRNRPIVRQITFWHEFVHALITRSIDTTWKLDMDNIQYAHLVIRFQTDDMNCRDIDNYSVSPMVNALVSNGLVPSDHAKKLSYTMVWEPGDNTVDIKCTYSSLAFTF